MSTAAPRRRSREAVEARDRESARHLRVVEPARRRTGVRLISFFVLIAFFVVLFAAATFQVRLVTNQKRIDQLDRQATVAQAEYERRRLEVDRLSAPERVVDRARALGMVQAENPTWLAPGSPDLTEGTHEDSSRLHAYLDVKPYLQDNK